MITPDHAKALSYHPLTPGLALWVHRREAHGEGGTLAPDLVGGAFTQALDARPEPAGGAA